MILPIGHEQNRIFRQPWVTYAVMALCVLVFAFTHFTGPRRLGRSVAGLQQAVEYHRTHPYLKLDPRLNEILRARDREDGPPASLPTKPPDLEFVNLEQVELDGLTKAGFDALAELPERAYGLVPAHFSALSLVTHLFLHAGFLHLLGNLLFLYLSAPFLEDVWGRPFFAAFYLAAGAVSGTFYALRYPGLDLPLIGASGAIAGVIGAFLVRHWNRRLRFLYWFGLVVRGTFTAPAWAVLPLYFLQELWSAYTMDVLAPGTGGAGVAYWAHVSGFGFGVLTAAAVKGFGVERRFLAPALDAQRTVVDNSGLDRALELRSQGKRDEAWALLLPEVRKNQGNADGVALLWEWAKEDDRAAAAAPFVVRGLREEAQKGDPMQAYLLWREVCRLAPEVAVPPAVGMRLAEALVGAALPQEAKEVAAQAWARAAEDTPEGVRERLARLAAGAPPTREAQTKARVPLAGGARSEADGSRKAGAPPAKLAVTTAVPLSLEGGALVLQGEGGETRTLPLDRIRALAAGAVGDGGERLVLDLVVGLGEGPEGSTRVVRLDGRQFDARRLVPSEGDPRDAFLSLAGALLVGSGAAWLFGESATHLIVFRTAADYDGAFRRALGRWSEG